MAGAAMGAGVLVAACGSAATTSPPTPAKATVHGALVEIVGGPQTLMLSSLASGHLAFSLQDASLVGMVTSVHVGPSGKFTTSLAPGTYFVNGTTTRGASRRVVRCGPFKFAIKAGSTKDITVACTPR